MIIEGSGSGRPKNMWIRIRIHNPAIMNEAKTRRTKKAG
jgi:hypothetical protein